MRLAVLCLCLGVALKAEDPVTLSPLAGFDDFVNTLLAKWQIAGATLAVCHNGRLVLEREYGMPGATTGTSIQSNTTSAAETLRLLEHGKLSLDDPGLLESAGQTENGLVGKRIQGSSAYLFRQTPMKVDVALLFDTRPADSASFEADVAAGVVTTAFSIKKWPPIDLFVDGPELLAADVVNAADYRGGGVAPSEVVVLFPSNAGPPEMASWGLDIPHKARYSIDSLGGTRVLFDGIAAPMVYAESGQVCAIVPYGVARRKTTEVVLEYQGRQSPPVTLPVVASAPALFTLDASGAGQAAMLNETGCCNSVRNPAVRGSVASLYATGEGLPLPGAAARANELPVKVTVGGVPAKVTWMGNVGVLAVNFRVPANAPVGDFVPLELTVGNAYSSAAVTMAVRSARQQILLVGGGLAIRRQLTGILAGAGYDVFTAQDGGDAMEKAGKHNVDLVMFDLELPAAPAVIGMIRKQHPQVKTVALSRTMTPEVLRVADILEAQAVLSQPLAAEAVLKKVHLLLQRRPAVY